MTPARGRRAEEAGAEDAERLLARFVHNVIRARRGARGDDGAPEGATSVVSPPSRPRRRRDERTEPFHKLQEEPSVQRVGRRRLLGQEELGSVMTEEERRKLLLELSVLYRHGHIDDVLAELESVRRSHSFDVELHGALADFFLDRGDVPRASELLFGMVDAYFERKDTEASRRCLERVRAIDPDNRRLKSFEKLLDGSPAASGASPSAVWEEGGGND